MSAAPIAATFEWRRLPADLGCLLAWAGRAGAAAVRVAEGREVEVEIGGTARIPWGRVVDEDDACATVVEVFGERPIPLALLMTGEPVEQEYRSGSRVWDAVVTLESVVFTARCSGPGAGGAQAGDRGEP
jgi:hypothetical protein